MTEVADILRRIVDQRRVRVGEALESGPGSGLLARGESIESLPRSFVESLASIAGRPVIAEIKLGSPRLGSLQGRVDPEKQARLYAENGAAAISVVVEPDFFHGSYALLSRCRQASGLPALAKDFVVHPIQLEWARRAGAAAVLLIAALQSAQDLLELANQARRLGLVPLVECHARTDLDRLGSERWELVGVNNRDLRTLEVDLEHSMELLSELPAGSLKVAESGIRDGEDVTRLAAAGFDAFLVGESLLLAEDPGAGLRDLVGRDSRR